MTGSADAGGRVPDFFIVGHQKSGTSALYEMLRTHPQVFMPDLKEPKFFGADLPARTEPDPSRGLPATLADYRALYRDAGSRVAGDASPTYINSRLAAREIAGQRPDAKVIAIFREPASFIRSLHLQMVQSRVEDETDLGRALEGESVTRGGETVRRYSDQVRYTEQIERFEESFPPEQLMVLIYDDFRADNAATLRRVLAFLGVDEELELKAQEVNPAVRVRNPGLDRMVHRVSAGSGPFSRAVKRVTPQGIRRRALQATQQKLLWAEPQAADEQFMAQLRERFRGEVDRFGAHIGRDLIGLWGYGTGD